MNVDRIRTGINDLGNGLLLEPTLHKPFGCLRWGIEPWYDGKIWRYRIETFDSGFFARGSARDGAEIVSNRTAGHPLPDLQLCGLHLVVCRVACAAETLNDLFFHDPNIVITGRVRESTSPTHLERVRARGRSSDCRDTELRPAVENDSLLLGTRKLGGGEQCDDSWTNSYVMDK